MKVRTDLQAVTRRRKRYSDPTDRYVARFGSPWRRIGAAAVDWVVCYVLFLLVSIPLGMLQTIGTVSWEAGDFGGEPGHVLQVAAQVLTVVPVLAYWALLLPTSQTFGMRVVDIRLVSMRSGNGLSYVAAAVRSVVATLIAGAVYAVYLNTTAYDKGERLDETSQILLDASYVLAGVGCVSALAMLLTPTHRSLIDRLFGTAAVDELEATTPHFGPWGPVDAFDTSHR